ncbi:Uncharacterised protein [Mycobacteroides abscessus subsp. abscessus]|nr:Uncharacterised protein [Mycobacteroides abscessus subsp. abscessus]
MSIARRYSAEGTHPALRAATMAAPFPRIAAALTTPSSVETKAVGYPRVSTPMIESLVPLPGPQRRPAVVRPATPPAASIGSEGMGWMLSPRRGTPGMSGMVNVSFAAMAFHIMISPLTIDLNESLMLSHMPIAFSLMADGRLEKNSTMALNLSRMPVHTPSAVFTRPRQPAAIPSQTRCRKGHAVLVNQSTTAEAASLMPFQAASTMRRNVSECL